MILHAVIDFEPDYRNFPQKYISFFHLSGVKFGHQIVRYNNIQEDTSEFDMKYFKNNCC